MAEKTEISIADQAMILHNATMEGVDNLLKNIMQRSQHILVHLRQLIKFQSEELTIFRQMEGYIRSNQLTEEDFVKTLDALAALRKTHHEQMKPKDQGVSPAEA